MKKVNIIKAIQNLTAFFALFISLSEGQTCGDQIIREQLDQQKIIYSCQSGIIMINGEQSQQKNISLNLEFKNIKQDEKTQQMVYFSSIQNLHFIQLSFINNIFENENSTSFNFLYIQNCTSTIESLIIQQDQEFIYLGTFIEFSFYDRTTINSGLINFSQNIDSRMSTGFITFGNGSQSNLNNLTINADGYLNKNILEFISTDFVILNNFQINIKIVNFDQKLTEFNEYQFTLHAIKTDSLGKTIELNDFQVEINSDQIYQLYFAFLIHIETQKAQVNNFLVQLKNIAYQIIFFNSAFVSFNNFKFLDSLAILPFNFETIIIFINFDSTQSVEIDNFFVSNVQVQNFQMINFSNNMYISLKNLKFTKYPSQNDQVPFMNNKFHENQHSLSWMNPIFVMNQVNQLTIDNVNISGLSFKGEGWGIFTFVQTTLIEISNVNIFIDSQISFSEEVSIGYLMTFEKCEDCQFILKKTKIIIDSQTSEINLLNSIFFFFQVIKNSKINIDDFFVNVVNLNVNQNFIVNSSNGSLIRIIDSYTDSLTQVILNNININNFRSQGQGSFFSAERVGSLILTNSAFENVSSKGNGGVFQVKIYQQLTIINTTVSRCHSDYFAGFLYYSLTEIDKGKFDVSFSNVTIIGCSAMFGGVFVGSELFQNPIGINFINNTAILYGNEYSSNMTGIQIKNIYQYNNQFEEDDLKYIYKNNYYFWQEPFYFLFNNEFILSVDGVQSGLTYCIEISLFVGGRQIYIPDYQKIQQYLSLTNLLKTQQTKIQYLQQDSYLSQASSFFFMIQLPIFENFVSFKTFLKLNGYTLKMQFLEMNGCLQGQVYQNGKCSYCSEFSSTNRDDNGLQTNCTQCNKVKFRDCYAYKSFVNKEFVRYNNYTLDENLILKCSYYPSNCRGGEHYGNDNCADNHIGPQCMECDYENIKGDGWFMRNNCYQCNKCDTITFDKWFFGLQFLIGFLVVSVLYKMVNQLMLFKEKQTNILNEDEEGEQILQKQQCQQQQLNENQENDCVIESYVYFKFIVFYLQIIYVSSFYSQKVVYGSSFFSFQQNLYNPFIGSYFNYLKCFFSQNQINSFSVSHTQIILIASCPLFFYLFFILVNFLFHSICFIVRKIMLICKNKKKKKSQIESQFSEDNIQEIKQQLKFFERKDYKNMFILLFFIFYSISLQQIENLLQGTLCISFEQYGKVSLADLILPCNDHSLKLLRNILYIPLIIIYTLFTFSIHPYLIYQKYVNRKKQSSSILAPFSMEYSDSLFYWDLIRNTVRIFMLSIIYLWTPLNNIIAAYLLLLHKFNPFQKLKFKRIEIGLIISGMFVILFYIANSLFQSSETSTNTFTQIMVLLVNLQAFVIMIALFLMFIISFL